MVSESRTVRRRGERGETLLELLVAMAVIGIVVVGGASGLLTAE